MECPRCGKSVGSMEAHMDHVCQKQQEKNAANRGDKCVWCSATAPDHKEGCPRLINKPTPKPFLRR